MAKRARPEDDIQRAVVQYLDRLEALGRLAYFHVPNGGRRSKAEAQILKGLGVRAGVPDLVIVLPGGTVCWLELKAPDGEASVAQAEWFDRLAALGHRWEIAFGLDQAIAVIDALPGVKLRSA